METVWRYCVLHNWNGIELSRMLPVSLFFYSLIQGDPVLRGRVVFRHNSFARAADVPTQLYNPIPVWLPFPIDLVCCSRVLLCSARKQNVWIYEAEDFTEAFASFFLAGLFLESVYGTARVRVQHLQFPRHDQACLSDRHPAGGTELTPCCEAGVRLGHVVLIEMKDVCLETHKRKRQLLREFLAFQVRFWQEYGTSFFASKAFHPFATLPQDVVVLRLGKLSSGPEQRLYVSRDQSLEDFVDHNWSSMRTTDYFYQILKSVEPGTTFGQIADSYNIVDCSFH